MAWRTALISNPARLSIDASRLIIEQEAEVPLPLEDLAVLILESPEVTLSSGTLARLAEAGTTVLVCGPQHTPVLAACPFLAHSRVTKVHRLQLETSLPFRKRCWQAVVQQKIRNQAEALALAGRPGAERIRDMAGRVTSGDTLNMESVAARDYFALLFGDGFSRGGPAPRNRLLDYGYAILRAAVVRSLAAHGLLLTQGIHHRSELNAFNLADDFLEPFRPLVDLKAAGMERPEEFLAKEDRAELARLLHYDLLLDGQKQAAIHACDLTAASFASACRRKDPALLKLPSLLALSEHEYE